MSDYAKFVQAVASNTRDAALEGVLEENRILRQKNEELWTKNYIIKSAVTHVRASLREARERNDELTATTVQLQQRTNSLHARATTELNSMRAVVHQLEVDGNKKQVELDAERTARKAENELNIAIIEKQAKRIQRLRTVCVSGVVVLIGVLVARSRTCE